MSVPVAVRPGRLHAEGVASPLDQVLHPNSANQTAVDGRERLFYASRTLSKIQILSRPSVNSRC